MQFRKVLALLFAFAMMMTMIPLSSFASDSPEYTDMPDDWSTAALKHAASNGLLLGDSGMIRPADNLTRAQMAAVVNRAFGAAEKAPLKDFKDVSEDAWYFNDMAKAVHMGTFAGNGDGMLRPDENITREEAFAVLARAFKLPAADGGILDKFTDKDSVSSWAKEQVSALVKSNYVSGFAGKLNPKANIKRAEFAQLMDNFVKQYINHSGTYTDISSGNIMINVPGVTLKGVEVKGDLIIGDGVGDGDVILENVDLAGRMVVRGGGINSIIVKGDSHIDTIIIVRVDGQVRIYAEDGTEVGTVVADGSDNVTIEGNFKSVVILADDISVTAKNATVENAEIKGDRSVFIAQNDSHITTITVEGSNARITGDGKVDEVFVHSSDVTVETVNTAVTAGTGSIHVMAAGTIVGSGETAITKPKTTSSGSSRGPSVTDPSVIEANSFKSDHAAVLALTVDTVQISDEAAVDGVLAAYAGLSDAAKTKLSAEKAILDNLKTKIGLQIQTAADQAAADQVAVLITALPAVGELVLTDKSDVEAARTAYNGLTAAQKALVANFAVLAAAESKITELEATVPDTYDRSWPVMAYDSKNNRYLMVFFKHDLISRDYNLYGRLVDTNGAYIGSEFSIRTSRDVGGDYNFKPNVAFDSTNKVYLVVWNESALYDSAITWDIYGQKISADGSAIGEPFAITDLSDNKSQTAPFIAFDDVNNKFMVAYRYNIDTNPYHDDIYGRFVNIGGADPVVSSDIVIYHDDYYSQSLNDAVFNGSNKFLLPVQTYRNAYIMEVDNTTGNISTGISFGSTAHGISLAYDDANNRLLAVWAAGTRIYGRYINQDGSADGIAFPLSDDFDGNGYVSAAFAEGNFYVVWEDEQYYNDYDSYVNIAAKKIDAATKTLSDQINVTEGSNQAQAPFICGGNNSALAAWTMNHEDVPNVIMLQHWAAPRTAARFTSLPQAADVTIPADVTVGLTVDQAATAYYAVVQEDRAGFETPAPTAEQLKELTLAEGGWADHYGVVPVLAAGSQSLSGRPDGEQILIQTANAFKAARTYTVYVVLETDAGVFSEVAGATFNTLEDTNSPVFNQSGNRTGVWSSNARSLIITEKTLDYDEYYDLFIWVVKATDAPLGTPSAAEVKAKGKAYEELLSGVQHNITYTGLDPGTEYKVYLVAQDYSGDTGLYSDVLPDNAATIADTLGPDKAGISDHDCYVFLNDYTSEMTILNKQLVIQFNEDLYVVNDPGFIQAIEYNVHIYDGYTDQTLKARGDTVNIIDDTMSITFNAPPTEDFQIYIDADTLQDTNPIPQKNKYEISINVRVPDITPAAFEAGYPKEYAAGISDQSIAVELKLNEDAAVFWVLLPKDAAAPAYESTIASQTVPDKIKDGSMSIDECQPAVISITGLQAGTGYDLWITAVDGNGNYMAKQKTTLMTATK